MFVKFNMSCGHIEEKEVADPNKYLKIDRAYYEKQGLCDACRAALHEEHRRYKQSKQQSREAAEAALTADDRKFRTSGEGNHGK